MKGYVETLSTRAAHPAFVAGDRSITYAELDHRASQLAHVLREAGLADGDRLGVMLPNSIELSVALAASAKVMAPVVTLNWHLRPDEVAWILEDSEASVLIAHEDLRAQVEAVTAKQGRPVVWVGGDYESRLAGASPEPVPYQWPTSWPVLYTSGTSGRPKGVIHGGSPQPEVMEMALDGLVAMWGYQPDDVHLVAGPMYHAGPSGYAGATLFVGGTVVAMDGWDARDFLRLVAEHRVTTTFLTPAHFIRILEVSDAERATYDLTSLRHVIHGGAPCPASVKVRIIAALPATEIWELYGASEGGATRVSSAEWLERPGTVGRPWPGVEIRIVDRDTGEPKATGEDGLIYVRPARGRFEYHNDAAKTADTWREDDFTVGDIGHLDDDGYLYLTDRASDLIIRAGVNVYPREVEDVLYGHPAVVDCAVFGVPDDRDGEHPVAVVETRSPVTADELIAYCRDRLDPYKCPVRVELVATLPRDPNGKVLKRHLRDVAWAGTGRQI